MLFGVALFDFLIVGGFPYILVLIFTFIPFWACVSIFKKLKGRSVAPTMV